jgi:hypothetical protein
MTAWLQRIGNALVVTVVTILLWLFAAGRTKETATVEMRIRFVSAEPDRVQVEPVDSIPVELSLSGSRREIGQTADRLSGKTLDLRIGRDGVPGTVGEHTVDLVQVLRRSEDVGRGASAIAASKPSNVSIVITETEVLTATIEPILPGAQLLGEAVAEPATARIIVPRALAAAFGSTPRIEAFVPTERTASLQPGRGHTLDVALRVPEVLQPQRRLIRIEPERTRVTFTLVANSSTTTLRLVPVQIAGPPAELEQYLIDVDPEDAFLRDVEVSGPTEAIRTIESGSTPVFAFVHLSADDLARRPDRARIVLWNLPPDVTVTRIGTSTDVRPFVRLRIEPRPRP